MALLVVGIVVFFSVKKFGHHQSPVVPVAKVPVSPLKSLVSELVISPILSFDGQKVWFMTADGKMFRKNIDGTTDKEEYVLPQKFQDATSVIWPDQGGNFIVVENLSGHTRYNFFDSFAKAFTQYPEFVRDPRFLPGGSKIVYDWTATSTQDDLKISDSNGSNFSKVTTLLRSDYEFVPSPAKQEMVAFTKDMTDPTPLFIVDLFTGKFRAITAKAPYQGVSFSPDGNQLLIARMSAKAGADPSLELVDLLTNKAFDLGLAAPIEQTAWRKDSQSIYIGTSGSITKFDVATQQKSEAYKFADTEKYQPTNLFAHPQLSVLFFVDQKTGFLYRLDLK